MKKAKIIGIIVGVFAFIAVIAGVTYAWFTWKSNEIIISGSSNCFNIDYGISQQIGSAEANASLKLGRTYTDGLYASVTANVNASCTGVTGLGKLYLTTNTAGTSATILSGALKYTVLSGTDLASATIIDEGIITTADKKLIADNITLNTTTVNKYFVYVWIDGELADNTYANNTYSGYISLEAVQNIS